MSWERLLVGLRRVNTGVATAVGVVLAATALFVIADITLRQLGRSLGGSDEISGYAMAIAASWGLGYALLERAHVRIDLIHRRLPGGGRAFLDVVAIASLAATVALVAFQCWPVLEKSLSRGSRANTPLETPLWIPQALWFGGWLWFAVAAVLMLAAATGLLVQRRREPFDRWFGATDEVDTALKEAPPATANAEPPPGAGSGASARDGGAAPTDPGADPGGDPGGDADADPDGGERGGGR